MKVRFYTASDQQAWDSYIDGHVNATHCHLSGWKPVIENTYGHKGYYLLAEENSKIHGILPLIYMKSFIFGKRLVSMPFLNYGGILANNKETEIALLSEATKLGQELKANDAELRHITPLSCLSANNSVNYTTKTHKVRMVLDLPASGDHLLKSFKSKLRSQISRPQREGMTATIGGAELIDPFYRVFSIKMRDLGSPVHSKRLFREIFLEFPDRARIGLVTYTGPAVAAGLIFSFRDTVEIPWASSLRKYDVLSPNMLLYWVLLEHSCNNGFKHFDFGRSTAGESTHKFKEQWGAKPSPLYWHDIALNGKAIRNGQAEKSKFARVAGCWKKFPLPISNMLGPFIRKNISL